MTPLKPLFSPRCDLVGWCEPGRAVFDPAMNHVAFIVQGHAYAAASERLLGAVDGPNLHDLAGLPVAWNPEQPIRALGAGPTPPRPMRPPTPMRPMRPIPPRRPLFPSVPHPGWSPLGFEDWCASGDAPEPPADAPG